MKLVADENCKPDPDTTSSNVSEDVRPFAVTVYVPVVLLPSETYPEDEEYVTSETVKVAMFS